MFQGPSSKGLLNSYDPGLNASTQISLQNYYGGQGSFHNNGDYHRDCIHYYGDYYYYLGGMLNTLRVVIIICISMALVFHVVLPRSETVISTYRMQPPSHWFQNLSGSNPSIIPRDSNVRTSIPSFASQAEALIPPSWMQPPSPWFSVAQIHQYSRVIPILKLVQTIPILKLAGLAQPIIRKTRVFTLSWTKTLDPLNILILLVVTLITGLKIAKLEEICQKGYLALLSFVFQISFYGIVSNLSLEASICLDFRPTRY